MSREVTQLKFYMNYPLCGHCTVAWDMVYQRQRCSVSPEHTLRLCPAGGCDPEIWDFLDDLTGYPLGWQLRSNGRPDWKNLPEPPMADNDCFHRRDREDDKAPWRRHSAALLREVHRRNEAKRNQSDDEIVWDADEDDEDDEETFVPDDEIEW